MRFTGLVLAMFATTKAFAGLGVEVGGSYEMSTVAKLIPDYGFNDPADVKLSGLKFHLGIPISFVDSPDMTIYVKPTIGYLSTKSGTFEVPAEGDASFKLDHTYSAIPVGAEFGVGIKSGDLVFGAGVFYEMEINAKNTMKKDGETTLTSKSKGSNMGLKLNAGMLVTPAIGLTGFFSYGAKTLEITEEDSTKSKFKASGMGFGAALTIALDGGSGSKKGKKKKSKSKKSEMTGDAASESTGDSSTGEAKPKKSKKKSKKE